MRIAAIGLLLLALLSPIPAQAQTACQYTLDTTIVELSAAEMPFFVADDPDVIAKALAALAGAGVPAPDNVTRIIVAVVDGGYYYGFEIDGCLTPPQPVPPSLVSTSGLSGRYSFGTFAWPESAR